MGLAFIIDDDPVVRQILQSMLLSKNFTSQGFEKGEDALNTLRNCISSKSPLPDLILLDFMLDNETAVEILNEIKVMVECQKTPVIVLSSNSEDELKPLWNSFQPDGFLQKPFTTSDLNKILANL